MKQLLLLFAVLTLTGCEAPDPLEVAIHTFFSYVHKELGINREIPKFGDEECLPEHLRGKAHDDWPPPINAIPRSWTVVCGSDWPEAPELLAGDSGWTLEDKHRFGHFTDEFLEEYGSRLDIPKPKHWVVTAVYYDWIPLPMFAITFPNGWHFRDGALRYDYVDKYWEIWTLAFHKIDF